MRNKQRDVIKLNVIKQTGIFILLCTLLVTPLQIFAAQPLGTLNVVTDGSVLGNGLTDDTVEINTAIASAQSQGLDIYFPEGEYLISGPINLLNGVSLYGESDGLSVIMANDGAPRLGDSDYYGDQDDIDIEDLHFLNVAINCYGPYKKRYSLRRCIFMATSPDMHNEKQVSWGHIRDGVLEHCLFLRQFSCSGVGLSTYKTQFCNITENIWGLDLKRIGWLNSWSGALAWSNLTGKLAELKTRYNLDWDQGRFVAAHYPGDVVDEIIAYNIYNLSPQDDHFPEDQDHIVYAKNYTNLKLIGNWFRGDAMDATGGLKLRNTAGPTVVAANHFVNTPVFQYTYKNHATQVYKDALIYRNYFTLTPDASPSSSRRAISYWEDATIGGDSNIIYHENVFNSTPGATNVNVNITWRGNPDEHAVYNSNFYETTSESIPFMAGDVALTHSTGAPDSSLTDPYANYPVQILDIPEYGTTEALYEDFLNQTISGLESSGWSFSGGGTETVSQTSNSDWLGARKTYLKLSGGSVVEPYAQVAFDGILKGELSLKVFTAKSDADARVKLLDDSGNVLFSFRFPSRTELNVENVLGGFTSSPMSNSASHNLLSKGAGGITELTVKWDGSNIIWQAVNREKNTGESVYNSGFQEDTFAISGIPTQLRVDMSKFNSRVNAFCVTDIQVVEDIAGQNTAPAFRGPITTSDALAGAAYNDTIAGEADDADGDILTDRNFDFQTILRT